MRWRTTTCVLCALVVVLASTSAHAQDGSSTSARLRFALGVPFVEYTKLEFDDSDAEATDVTFSLLTGSANAELHVGNDIAMGGVGVGVVRSSTEDADGDEITALGWRVVPSVRLSPTLSDSAAVFLSVGFLLAGTKIDDDGDEIESLELGANFQLGLHLFATRTFSVDPRLSLEYVVGSQEGDSFRDELDYKRLRVGLQLAFSGWGGREGDVFLESDDDAPPPPEMPPAPVTRAQVRAQLAGGAIELIGDATDPQAVRIRFEMASRQPALSACTEAVFEMENARGVVRELVYESRASLAGVDERLSGWMAWDGIAMLASTHGATLSLCGQRFQLDPATPALLDFVRRMRVAAAQMGITLPAPPSASGGGRAF